MVDMQMRAVVLSLLIAATAAPAFAQADADWNRRRNEAAMAQDAARRQSLDFEREARAREQRARTEETLRSLQSGELAGGPSAISPYRPSAIAPMEPPRTTTPLPVSDEAARMDALMAAALARSNARVRAASGDGGR